jgi:hypothetical protein
VDQLVPVSWTTLVKNLKRLGFAGTYQGGKPPYMTKGNLVLTIPNPHRDNISIDLLARILKRAKVSHHEWTGK